MCAYIRLFLLLLLPLFITSCIKDTYEGNCCDNNSYTDLTVANIVLDTAMPPYQSLLKQIKEEDKDSRPDIRFIIAVYTEAGELYEKKTVTASDINQTIYAVNVTFHLPNNTYRLVFWADFVEHASSSDFYYDTQDLKNIKLEDSYIANTELKNAYTAYKVIDLTMQESTQIIDTVTLQRPFAKYRIIANDLQEYIRKGGVNPEQITTGITYHNPIYNSYNAVAGKPNSTSSQESFTGTVQVLSSSQLLLSWDYVWAGEDELTLKTKLTIYDATNTKINTINNLIIPCLRNKVTTITGAFLTKKDDSGIGIVTEYEGEINVPLP